MESSLNYNKEDFSSNVIMHIDMDCFFVSVGLRSRPELKGLPVAVTHAKSGRGRQMSDAIDTSSKEYRSYSEVASCNYEARKFGIRNGMLLGTAFTRCPSLKVIPYDFESYAEVSRKLYDLILSFTIEVEAVSCDEMYVNLTDVLSQTNCHPEVFATFIRSEVKSLTDCDASVGIGPNVLVAKLGSKNAKPNGQCIVSDCQVKNFMSQQKVSTLPGIGRSLEEKLAEVFNVETCADLMKVPTERLRSCFGPKMGDNLYNLCRGIDRSHLKFDQSTSRKSVSVEVNYGIRFQDFKSLESFLIELCQELVSRMNTANCRGRNITVKLKTKSNDAPDEPLKFMGHGICDNVSRSTFLPIDTNSLEVISKSVVQLIKSFNLHVPNLRGIGIQVTRLTPCSTNTSLKSCHTIEEFFSNSNSKSDSSSTSSKASTSKDVTFLSYHQPTSLDDIDENVLNDLPDDIKEEVMTAFSVTSRHRQNSPQKSGERSQHNKSKSVALKAGKSGKVTLNSSSLSSKKSFSSKGPLDKFLSASNKNQKQSTEASTTTFRTIQGVMQERGKFCGIVDVDEICSIVRKWIVTEASPEDEDVSYISQFLLNSIEDREFEQVQRMMNVLYEEAILRQDIEWIEAYNTLVGIVRSELEEISQPNDPSSTNVINLISSLCFLEKETCEAILNCDDD